MKNVLISGYYGFNNTGDEAMIETLASELAKRNYRLVVLSSNPDKTRELYNVEAYDRFKFFSILFPFLKKFIYSKIKPKFYTTEYYC